jgi:hypothetical protein
VGGRDASLVSGHVAVDFETYYDADCSIRDSTVVNYVGNPKFDAYLVSVYAPDFTFVGNPKDLDWSILSKYSPWVAHNAGFDSAVFEHERSVGNIKYDGDPQWECTADLSVYIQAPRSLQGASYALLDQEVSKEVRDSMKGKNWADIVGAGMAEDVLAYALADSELCYALWAKYSHLWPDTERMVSKVTRLMSQRGVKVDEEKLNTSIDMLEQVVFDSRNNIPWVEEYDSKYKKNYPPTSVRGLALTCDKHGIDPPASTAEDSDERKSWEAEHGKKFPWIKHMGNFRKANKHLKIIKRVKERLINGVMPYGLKYFGADATGRWSGDAGFNTQNMPRGETFGVDIRSFFVPRKGKKFVIADLSQIEPRCLSALIGDWNFLDKLATGMSPYEAHARDTMNWTGGLLKKENSELYTLAKARVLSLGYGASWQSFIKQAGKYGASEILRAPVSSEQVSDFRAYLERFSRFAKNTNAVAHGKDQLLTWFDNAPQSDRNEAVNAYMQVMDFRNCNPALVKEWNRLDRLFRDSASQAKHGSKFTYVLPSGRALQYFNIHKEPVKGYCCFTQMPDAPDYKRTRYMYGSKIFQNACQSFARDIFADIMVRLHGAGYDIVLQIHDEVVIEVDAEYAEEAKIDILKFMSTPPHWAEDLPLSADAVITDRYQK